tara:strand:+ start:430 stop:549 length:120 start_codon:yes stop_codon:yes gene_type:complete
MIKTAPSTQLKLKSSLLEFTSLMGYNISSTIENKKSAAT